jgi:hypothetical protein
MDGDEYRNLAWRNHVADWHIARGMPDCGCDDDTPNEGFCTESAEWADQQLGHLPDPELEGPPDKWDAAIWTAAWGHNATLIVTDKEFRLPKTPSGTNWLVTRMLVRGIKAMEVALVRMANSGVVTMGRGRVIPEPDAVFAKASDILQQVLG